MPGLALAEDAPARAADSDHAVRFYERDESLLEEVADYLDRALRSGGMAIAIATETHRAELDRLLSSFGGPIGRSTTWFSGSITMLDASETLDLFMVDGFPDRDRFEAAITPIVSKASPGKPLHAFGEMVAVLCERGQYDAAIALEGLWNDIAGKYSFGLFCAYPRRLFTDPARSHAFRHVCDAHGQVLGVVDAWKAPGANDTIDAAELQRRVRMLESEVARVTASERTLRQRERELCEFLDNASEGIHKVAADGTIIYANRAELAMLGYAWHEYVGHNIAEFYLDEALILDILGRLQCGEVLQDQAAQLKCRDGTSKHVLINSSGYYVNGELQYTRCFTRDATERVARERALASAARERERLLDQAREAGRAKDEFLAMLGHELRNPLSPIVTALQLMRMRGETGTAREQAIIARQVDHMVRLVDDLLDISKVTRGKIELKREAVQLSTVLTNAVEQAAPLLEQRQHRLDIDIEPGLACECDPTRVAQVVANLLTNSARYTASGGDIRLRASHAADGFIAISVKDNGSGISAQLLPRVFDLFFQGDRGVDRTEGGLGIGLALVRSLVELHGGTVHAASEGEGRGSEFTVRLPRGSFSAQESRAMQASQSPTTEGARRVMLVDDNVDAAETLGELLRTYGHDVTVFTDPVKVVGAIRALQPEVAVLDIGLPVMDGYELGAKIREACGESCTLIALTGYGQDADKARSEAAGFRHHLTKPISFVELLDLLE